MRRGEIWTGAGGSYLSKPRPVIVIQDDNFANLDSVTVVPLTSVDARAPLLRPDIAATTESGLDQPSWAMIDKISTLRRPQLVNRLGAVSEEELRRVERLLAMFLGFAR